MIITKFYEKDYRWTMATYYLIYEKNGEKWIKLVHSFDRGDRGKDYLSWLYIHYSDQCEMPLAKAIRFDIKYQIAKMLEERCLEEGYEIGRYGRLHYNDDEIEPEECFNLANNIVQNIDEKSGEIKGTEVLRLDDVNKSTSCGFYIEC